VPHVEVEIEVPFALVKRWEDAAAALAFRTGADFVHGLDYTTMSRWSTGLQMVLLADETWESLHGEAFRADLHRVLQVMNGIPWLSTQAALAYCDAEAALAKAPRATAELELFADLRKQQPTAWPPMLQKMLDGLAEKAVEKVADQSVSTAAAALYGLYRLLGG
jgi:hypothetical protein